MISCLLIHIAESCYLLSTSQITPVIMEINGKAIMEINGKAIAFQTPKYREYPFLRLYV